VALKGKEKTLIVPSLEPEMIYLLSFEIATEAIRFKEE